MSDNRLEISKLYHSARKNFLTLVDDKELSTDQQKQELENELAKTMQNHHMQERHEFQISNFLSKYTSTLFYNTNDFMWKSAYKAAVTMGNLEYNKDGEPMVYVKSSQTKETEFQYLSSSLLDIMASEFNYDTARAFVEVLQERLELGVQCDLVKVDNDNRTLYDEVQRVRSLPSFNKLKEAIKNDNIIGNGLNLEFIYDHMVNFRAKRSLHISPLSVAMIDVYYDSFKTKPDFTEIDFIEDVRNFSVDKINEIKGKIPVMPAYADEVLNVNKSREVSITKREHSKYLDRTSRGTDSLTDQVYRELLKLKDQLGMPKDSILIETGLFTDIGYQSFDFTVKNIYNKDKNLKKHLIHGVIEVDGSWHYMPAYKSLSKKDPAVYVSNFFDWISNTVRNEVKRESIINDGIPLLIINLETLDENDIYFALKDFLTNMSDYVNKHYYGFDSDKEAEWEYEDRYYTADINRNRKEFGVK